MFLGGTIPAAAPDFPASPQASPPVPLPPHEALRNAELALDAARHELRVANRYTRHGPRQRRHGPRKLQSATPQISAEQNTRDWIAANNAARAERVAQRGTLFRPSPKRPEQWAAADTVTTSEPVAVVAPLTGAARWRASLHQKPSADDGSKPHTRRTREAPVRKMRRHVPAAPRRFEGTTAPARSV